MTPIYKAAWCNRYRKTQYSLTQDLFNRRVAFIQTDYRHRAPNLLLCDPDTYYEIMALPAYPEFQDNKMAVGAYPDQNGNYSIVGMRIIAVQRDIPDLIQMEYLAR